MLRDRFTRYFGVWREGDGGATAVFDPLFARGRRRRARATRRSSVSGGYHPAHNLGHFRFLECSHLARAAGPRRYHVLGRNPVPVRPGPQDVADLVVSRRHDPGRRPAGSRRRALRRGRHRHGDARQPDRRLSSAATGWGTGAGVMRQSSRPRSAPGRPDEAAHPHRGRGGARRAGGCRCVGLGGPVHNDARIRPPMHPTPRRGSSRRSGSRRRRTRREPRATPPRWRRGIARDRGTGAPPRRLQGAPGGTRLNVATASWDALSSARPRPCPSGPAADDTVGAQLRNLVCGEPALAEHGVRVGTEVWRPGPSRPRRARETRGRPRLHDAIHLDERAASTDLRMAQGFPRAKLCLPVFFTPRAARASFA